VPWTTILGPARATGFWRGFGFFLLRARAWAFFLDCQLRNKAGRSGVRHPPVLLGPLGPKIQVMSGAFLVCFWTQNFFFSGLGGT